MCLSHGQVMSKVYLSELYFYLSRTIGHRFWHTLNYQVTVSSGTCATKGNKFITKSPRMNLNKSYWVVLSCSVILIMPQIADEVSISNHAHIFFMSWSKFFHWTIILSCEFLNQLYFFFVYQNLGERSTN